MINELVIVKAEDFGLDDNKALQIKSVFMPMLDAMVELENEANEVKSREINEITCKMAKEVRLKYVKIRTETAKIHKASKAFYLNGGRFVDAWKNAQLAASSGKEAELEKIEKHFELIEKEKLNKLEEARWEMIKDFHDESVPRATYNLSAMDEQLFERFVIGMKTAHHSKKQAELKVMEELEAEKQRQLLIELENKKLKEEALALQEEKRRIEEQNKKLLIETKKQEEQLIEVKKSQESADRSNNISAPSHDLLYKTAEKITKEVVKIINASIDKEETFVSNLSKRIGLKIATMLVGGEFKL